MISSKTEIYDHPDSEGWWWNENVNHPLQISSRWGDTRLFVQHNGLWPSEYRGRWQKVAEPKWPQTKADNAKKTT